MVCHTKHNEASIREELEGVNFLTKKGASVRQHVALISVAVDLVAIAHIVKIYRRVGLRSMMYAQVRKECDELD